MDDAYDRWVKQPEADRPETKKAPLRANGPMVARVRRDAQIASGPNWLLPLLNSFHIASQREDEAEIQRLS